MEKLYTINKDDCWIWNGSRYLSGYGQYKRGYAHRVFYELFNGPLIRNRHIHHKCHTKPCVNPAHLVQVTQAEHARLHRQYERRTCLHGHRMTPDNIYETSAGHWQCKSCNRVRQKSYNDRDNQKRREARRAIVEGVRRDFGRMPVKEVARKWGIGWRSVYRYAVQDPSKLGYFK
jgi:hypothetical protein